MKKKAILLMSFLLVSSSLICLLVRGNPIGPFVETEFYEEVSLPFNCSYFLEPFTIFDRFAFLNEHLARILFLLEANDQLVFQFQEEVFSSDTLFFALDHEADLINWYLSTVQFGPANASGSQGVAFGTFPTLSALNNHTVVVDLVVVGDLLVYDWSGGTWEIADPWWTLWWVWLLVALGVAGSILAIYGFIKLGRV